MGLLILRGGLVADGTPDTPAVLADVAIDGSTIAAIAPPGRLEAPEGAEEIDCVGHVVAPGFIDIHTHSDLTRLVYPAAESRVRQGITTEVVGNCGMSPAPIGAAGAAALRETIGPVDLCPELPFDWTRFDAFLDHVAQAPSAVNTLALVGHGSIRHAVLGDATRHATANERVELASHVDAALDAGAWGVSFGLMYSPGESADFAELRAVAAAAERREAIVTAHVRAYDGPRLLEATEELLAFADGGRVQLSHLRSIGAEARGVPERVLELLHRRRAEGLDVGADAYPYTAGHTTAMQLLGSELRSAGTPAVLTAIGRDRAAVRDALHACGFGPRAITIVRTGAAPTDACGQTLAALAAAEEADWADVLIDLLERYECAVDVIVEGSLIEDVELTLHDPIVSIGSDGATLNCTHTANTPHPRSFGTFPRALRMLLDGGMGLGRAIAKATSLPAERMGLTDRGRLTRGATADVVVLALDALGDRATYADPMRAPSGVRDVLVAGSPVLRDGELTAARPGRLLRAAA